MTGLSDKIKFIFKPFLLIATCFITGYTFLHWALFIKGGIPLKEDLITIWLPIGLAFIPILIWLRPGIKLLHFKNDNGSFGYQAIACFIIALPTIIAQQYLITATGELSVVDNVYQINPAKHTRFYSVKNFYIDKQHIEVRPTATVTGKHNKDFNMLLYVAMPIYKDISDTGKTDGMYWLGKKYDERISNSLSDAEKDTSYKAFLEKVQKEFDTTEFGKFKYLQVMGITDDHDEFNKTIGNSKNNKAGEQLLFEAKNEPFQQRNGNKLAWIFGSLGIGLVLFFGLMLIPKFNQSRLDTAKNGTPEKDTTFKELLEFFLPREDFYITPILIDLNLLVFMAMVLSGLGLVSFRADDLLQWGANYKPVTTDGQWWRLLTSTFLHGGIMHILANLYGLLFVGIFLEPVLGRSKYLLIYLVSGILASVASLWWHDATVSVGASGAIFGLYGFFLAALMLKVFPPDFSKALLTSTLVFVGFNLLMGFSGGIDNAAHIGGLITGFILGLIMAGQLKQDVESTIESSEVS